MAKILTEKSKMDTLAQKMSKYSGDWDGIARKISSVKNSIDMEVLAKSGIDTSLSKANKAAVKEKEFHDQMQKGINKVSGDIYDTDKALSSKFKNFLAYIFGGAVGGTVASIGTSKQQNIVSDTITGNNATQGTTVPQKTEPASSVTTNAAKNAENLAKLEQIKSLENKFNGSTYYAGNGVIKTGNGVPRECFGFASKTFYDMFGVDLPKAYKGAARYQYSASNNIDQIAQLGNLGNGVTTEQVKSVFSNWQVGDVIQVARYKSASSSEPTPHTMMLQEVTEDGVTVYEGNIGGQYGVTNHYTWDKFISSYLSNPSNKTDYTYKTNSGEVKSAGGSGVGITLYRCNK